MKYENKNDFEYYYDGKRLDIIGFIPKDKKTYLDIGCARGGTLKLLKDNCKNKDLELWGVEYFKDAFEEAKKIGSENKVFLGSGEENLINLPDGHFDVILCLDVLEHMAYPENFLRDMKAKLKDDGVLISSLPNVRYFTNLFNLIFKKDWKYIDAGILDYTHLRFFTSKSILRMYKNLDYKVSSHFGINPFRWRWFSFIVDILTLGFFRDTKYVQFLTTVKKKHE
jgi:2-polyprenyl-3-methyl-5-hydroxy-6-metoxy-1,4-benzoquinol methylase